jgi:predicted transcriptional regulator
MQREKRRTYTSLVQEYLEAINDFATAQQVVAAGKCPGTTVTKVLLHLQRHGVVDAVEQGGRLYWYATHGADDRVRTMEQRAKELGRTQRKVRRRKVQS